MAAVNYTRGVKLVLKVGNGMSPEAFTAFCTINAERGITFDSQTNDETIPDCDDPEALAFLVREKDGLSVSFTGGGMLHKNDVARMDAWWRSADPKNCQVILDDDEPDNVITWEGAFHLTQFELSGNRNEKVSATMTLASDGPVTPDFGANVAG